MSEKEQIYESLKNEVVYLFASRAIYKALYEANEQRLELLQEAAPILSVIFQKMLLDGMAITICRILDPKKTYGHENNTFFQLINEDDASFENLQNLSDLIEPIRQQRNKFLAHRDLSKTLEQFTGNTHNGETSFDLNFPISMQELDDILGKIQPLLNHVGTACMQYRQLITPLGPDLGVRKLISFLKDGCFFQELQNNQLLDMELLSRWDVFKYKDA